MPARRSPGPDQPDAQAVLELVAAGDSAPDAARACGLLPGTVWKWINAGTEPEPPVWANDKKKTKMRQSLWQACIKYSQDYEKARLDGKRAIAQEALKTIRLAASKGFQTTKIRRTKDEHGASKGEVTELVQASPIWTAAACFLERAIPEEYAQHSQVTLHSDLTLAPGEADEVVEACTDDEAKAIDRGDAKILGQVLARVRSKSAPQPAE